MQIQATVELNYEIAKKNNSRKTCKCLWRAGRSDGLVTSAPLCSLPPPSPTTAGLPVTPSPSSLYSTLQQKWQHCRSLEHLLNPVKFNRHTNILTGLAVSFLLGTAPLGLTQTGVSESVA